MIDLDGSTPERERAHDHSLVWQPIFDRHIPREPVTVDIRPIDQRLRHFASAAAEMGASPREKPAIIEVLCLLECTHGAHAVQRALPLVVATLAAAVATLGTPLATLATQRGYPHAGALAGALLEDALPDRPLRRVPAAGFRARGGSPHLEFDDIAQGACVLVRLAGAAALDASAVRATALVIQALRGRLGPHALEQRLAHCASVSELETLARAHGALLPAAWQRWRLRAMPHTAREVRA